MKNTSAIESSVPKFKSGLLKASGDGDNDMLCKVESESITIHDDTHKKNFTFIRIEP